MVRDALRIAFVAPFGLRAKGTTRARALPLARAVACRGFRVALFIPPYDSPQDGGLCWQDGDVTVINVALPGHGPTSLAAGEGGGVWHLRLAGRLLGAVRSWRPDVVHIFKPKGPSGLVGTALWLSRTGRGMGAAAGFRQPKRPWTLVVDSDDWEGEGGWNDDPRAGYSFLERRAFAWQERYGLAHADAWTVTSTCLRDRAMASGAAPGKVFLLPNGIADFASWPPETEMPGRTSRSVLLYTRFAGVRLLDVAILWRRVLELVPDATLTIVGRGLGGEERALASAAPGVRVIGWLEPAQMPKLFRQQGVAIVPWADTPPNRARSSAKVLELMAAGLPVVATAVGELPAMLGETGVLVEPGHFDVFAKAIADLLVKPQRGAALGRAARDRVAAKYTWDRLADVALSAYFN